MVTKDPSDKAVEAAREKAAAWEGDSLWRPSLDAAYPIIRADVIAEVVAALRKDWYERGAGLKAADFIEREFGGTS